ncbi:hypothetical protein GCM10027425_33770 [Alteromonas gracilis]
MSQRDRTTPDEERLLTPEEAAAATGLSLDELARLRALGAGPDWGQITRTVIRYSAPDLAAWTAREDH